ncbi:hypothetical protein WJX84_003424, partial [Apatococcus fuscideae]
MVFQAGTFSYKWLLSETHTVLKKQLKAENQELMLLAGAIAGLASALSVSKEDEGQDVEELAFRLLHQSIQQVEELKRYHALRSSLHLLDLQAWRFKKQILADAQGLTERLGKMTMHQNQSLRDAAGLALEAVLAQVAEEMAKQPQTHQELYSKMMGSVTQKLISPKSSNPEKTVAMRTIGALAKATHAIYGIPGIQKVMVHLPQTDQGQDEMEDKIAFNEVVLLQALTQHMIYLKATDESRLQQCLRAVTGISARYGQLWPKQRPRVHQPLCDLLSAASSQPGCLQIVLPRLVSTLLQHTLKPEEIADQQAGQEENIDLEPIWTKFMPLWLALLAPEQGSSLVDKDHIVQALYNGLIQAVLEILPVLDLARSNVVAQENFGPSSQAADPIASAKEAASLSSLQTFVRLAEFLSRLLMLSPQRLFEPWQMTFTSTCISYCRKYPFLSGFYRLLTSALRCLNSAQSPAPLAPLLGPSINPYLTPVSLKHHVGPTATAEEQAEGEDDEAEISAKQSARDIENNAAAAATRDADSLKEHPLLRARSELAAPDAPTLSGFSDGAWRGMQDLLGLSVYFEGSSEAVTVWLDCLLPQVADRAEKSPDRSCRVAACEFVHASILWMLGATADRTAGETSEDDAAPTKFHKVMQCLYPIVIRLAASAEPIAQQLFEPLLMQLAHYFTRSQAREAAATLALLDAVTDGLANATSAGVRDLCASATHELLEWSMRHRPKIDGSSKQPVSSYAILIMRRMYERLSHPEPYMRLGASKAMQRCVLAMRKHRSLAEDTCLEALRHCIMSLQQAADDHVQLGAIAAAREAIRGLTGLLTGGEGSDDLLAALKHADPVTKKASKMDDFIVWVWRQIICTNRYVREACMWILKHLCDLWKPESSMDDDQSGIASWVDELAKNNPEEIDSVKQALVLREPMPVAARAEALKLWLQELDAAVHCMAWMLQQTAMAASELLPADEITKPHAALQLLTFFDKYADVGLTEVPALTAHEGENTLERITYHGLQWLQQVIAEPFLDSYLDIVAKFVTVVLFQPSLLGLAQSNDVALSRMTLLAQELLQTADSRRPALLPSLQQQLRPTVERMLLEPKAAPEFSRQTHPVSADLMRGFQTIQQLQLPAKSSLISQEVLSKLPERLLEWAAGITAHAAAHQRTAAAQGLQLAIQLGLPNQPMLNVLLDPKAGEGFFVAYQIPVQAWVLFNNEASCKALGPALAGTDQSRVAEVVLSGTLQMLQQSKASNDGRSDPRQRSFLQSLLRHLGINSGSTNSPSNDAMLRLLRQMLTLDALTVLNPTGSELTDLVDYFVSILALRGPMHAHLKREALGLLPQLFSLPEVQMQRVMDALADLANDSFPSSSHDLQEGSTQETEYRRLLLLIMSGAVRAAEDKRDVSSLLEAMLPVLRELGEGEGHRYQDALRTRLALIAAAPWKGVDLAAADPASLVGMMDSEPQEAVHGQECMLQKQSFDQASAQAKAMFAYAWRYAMAANGQPLALRQAMMEYLLLPCLQYAPQVFISRTIQESIRNLMDVVNCKLGEWQPLRGDPEANLVAKAAAYRLLRIMYLALPVADIKETILEPFGGHKAVMQKAAADMKTLELDSRGALSKQARQAAYVCACSLMIASQTKEPLFKALLEKPETWARIVDTSRELDFQKQQRAIDSPSFHRREAAMQSRAALLRSSLSASMASSMMTSLSFGASIGGSIAGSSQLLTGSQQSSGPAVSLRQMTQDSLSMPFVDREQMAVPDAALQDALPTNEDDLDAEPVMLAAAQLVERAATLFEGGDGDTMPSWMQSLHLLAGSAETPAYLRLFLIKLVIHVDRRHVDRAASQPEVMLPDESGNPPPSIFAKYACQWFGPMVDVLTLGKSQEAGIHYMLRDAILVLLSWPSLWPPIGKNAQLTRSAAACLMEHLVKSAHSESAQVTKSNCDYIRVIASKWRAFNPISVAAILTHLSVAVPKDGERKALHAVVSRRALGMKLLCVGLLDREQAVPMLADPDMQGTICQVIQSLTLKGGQRFAEQTGETIGILLLRLTKQSSSTPDTEVVQQIWQETRQSLVAIHRSGQDDRFLFALDRLSSRHNVLPATLPERLVSLIQLPTDLGPVQRQRFGAHWAQSSALLMMELTNAHDNSRKPIYKKDLGNCTFVDYSVDTMRSGTHSTAPMFSPQWTASQATYNPSMSGSQTTQAISQGAPGMVHATQSHSRISQSFSLAPLGGDTLALSGKTSGSHSPSKSPHKATLYRRPNSRPSAGFSGMLGRIRRRQELRAAQEKARTSKVTLARQYRVGDLPDVQSITPESFLSPLGSMIASDKQMAQLAFGMLAASAMHDPACSPEMEDLQQELHTALSGALALHPADTQQLECLLEVAMGGNGIRLPINDVAQAAKKAGCLHSGIRLIEDSLLTDANSVARQQTGGRSRMQKHAAEHAVVPGVSCDMDSWAQLAALYKEAGFDHLTQVAYSSHITRCPATKEALQAVSSRRLNDAFTLFESLMRAAIEEEMEVEGVQHADEVQGPSKLQLMAGKEPSAQEEDLWFRERNRCMEMLGEWDDLLLVIDDEIKEDTARLFADGVERQFLRPYLRASLSSPAGQDRIKPLFDLGLASPDNARLVQQVAPVEHAAQTLLLKQWDRCHGTLKACMSVFTDRWTSLSPLDVSQRLQALSLLQPLTEAQEALTVLGISSTQLEPSSINGGHLHNLITSWQARWPSNQHADPHATLAVITMREILLGLLLPLSQRQGTLKECQALQTPCQSPWQVVTGLRNSLLLGGARSLGEQGFIDTAQDLITKHQAAAEDNDIQSSALQLRLRIEQVKAAADTPQWLLQRCELLILRGVAQTELATAAQVGLRTKPGVQQQHLSEAVQCLTKAV